MFSEARDKINRLLERYISFEHPWDYVAHFIVSFLLVFGVFFVLKKFLHKTSALFLSILATFFLGFTKEVWLDKVKEGFSGIDMTANILGIYLAYLVVKKNFKG